MWFGVNGMLTADTGRLFLCGLLALVLGTWGGLKLYGRLNEQRSELWCWSYCYFQASPCCHPRLSVDDSGGHGAAAALDRQRSLITKTWSILH